uniref:glycoside hydrolase family 3 protein n=1 Tax=uncultured Oscillibacter sp. TaxID=876091 RepID=UPI002729FF7F
MMQEVQKQARELVAQMTLEEKASLCSGKNFWESKAVERLGVRSFMLTDGPHGLRKQAGAADHLGLNASAPATCFPPTAATACSFDRALLREVGTAMGEECRAEEVGIILGPAANIKRSPLCGRNFEYFSEDPLVTGESAAGLIEGIQSQNVGACMKHYLANNQEKARVSSNSVVDQRALREIYLAGFEKAVKEAQPWTLMCSYNKINSVYASDHKELMTDVPRGEWGFQGAIMTDWGAMNDRVEAIKAGLDLEMPGPCDGNDEKIVQAVREGRLDETLVDTCAARMVELALRVTRNIKTTYNQATHHELAGRAARESAVLLRRGSVLPLKEGTKLAVIGDFARHPRYQGAGSSKINPTQLTSLCGALDARGVKYTYAHGFEAEGGVDEALIAQAGQTARGADAAVVMLGLPDSFESEGFDR